jgi:hypothetical protein
VGTRRREQQRQAGCRQGASGYSRRLYRHLGVRPVEERRVDVDGAVLGQNPMVEDARRFLVYDRRVIGRPFSSAMRSLNRMSAKIAWGTFCRFSVPWCASLLPSVTSFLLGDRRNGTLLQAWKADFSMVRRHGFELSERVFLCAPTRAYCMRANACGQSGRERDGDSQVRRRLGVQKGLLLDRGLRPAAEPDVERVGEG